MTRRRSPEITENAKIVLEARYLLRNERGEIEETPAELFRRVAGAVAGAEKRDRRRWAERFEAVMVEGRFLPNTPTLINAGKALGQLSACYVLPVEDSLDGIFDSLKYAAKVHQSGGGTGFSFSRLRPAGSEVKSTHGVASGPVSFIRIFDSATETIKQGGARRGANMGVLRVDHPDIEEFIDAKRDQTSIPNFNLSVGITDEFMRAYDQGAAFALRDPASGKEVRSVDARAVFGRMVTAAWDCGDPGLVFLDRINRFNPTPRVGSMESTNPCGEQPLLPYESCNLGSLNVGRYARGGDLDWAALREDIHLCVRFLDNVVDVNHYPLAQCRRITLRNRKIGLGVMGFADLLLKMRIPYVSARALELGERLMSFLDREAKAASRHLVRTRGVFPNWKGSMWEKLGYPPMRNATVSTVAPTGTISMIAGASSGIEPIFAAAHYRNVLGGRRMVEIHAAVREILQASGMEPEAALKKDDLNGLLKKTFGEAWSPADSVSVEGHVAMQAAFQRHSDSAVSKTINLPAGASEDEVGSAYLEAYRRGCKGITVYRDRSRSAQVLERPEGPATGGVEHCEVCD